MAAWEEESEEAIEAQIDARLEETFEYVRDNSGRHRLLAVLFVGAVILIANIFFILSGNADMLYPMLPF